MYFEGQQHFLTSTKTTDIKETTEDLWKSDENKAPGVNVPIWEGSVIDMQHDTVFCLDHVQASTGTADRILGLKYKVILGTIVQLFTV